MKNPRRRSHFHSHDASAGAAASRARAVWSADSCAAGRPVASEGRLRREGSWNRVGIAARPAWRAGGVGPTWRLPRPAGAWWPGASVSRCVGFVWEFPRPRAEWRWARSTRGRVKCPGCRATARAARSAHAWRTGPRRGHVAQLWRNNVGMRRGTSGPARAGPSHCARHRDASGTLLSARPFIFLAFPAIAPDREYWMRDPDFAGATAYALRRLAANLRAPFVYHSLAHTRDEVVPAVARLAALERVTGLERRLLQRGALS